MFKVNIKTTEVIMSVLIKLSLSLLGTLVNFMECLSAEFEVLSLSWVKQWVCPSAWI